MSIRNKLLAGCAGIFLPIALLCGIAIMRLGVNNAHMQTLYQTRLVPTVQLGQLVENLDQMRQIVAQYVLTTKGEESVAVLRDGVQIEIQTLDTAIAHAMDQYRATASDPAQRALLAQWPPAWRAFQTARNALLRLATGTPRQQHAAVDALTTTFNDRLNTPLDLAYALMGVQQRQGYDLYQESEGSYHLVSAALVISLVVLAVLSILCVLALARAIVRPLGQLTLAARRLAGGDTAVEDALPPVRRDEIGALSTSFRAMVARQQTMARAAEAVAQGDLTQTITPHDPADTLGQAFATMIAQLRALVGHVTGSATEVAAEAAHLSQASEQVGQASTQIARAIEEVARGASEQSQSASAALVLFPRGLFEAKGACDCGRMANDGPTAVG